MREAVIVAALRTPVGHAPRGALRDTRPDDMAAAVIRAILSSAQAVRPEEIEDVILGCAMPEAEQGMNVARIAALRAGLPVEVPAVTVNRFCSSGLQAIAMAAERILSGFADIILAGGAETMSLVPIGGHKILPNPALVDQAPDTYLCMGLTAENLAARYGISREEQDEFSLRSHQRALAAIAAGKFRAETVPLDVPLAASLSGGSKNGSSRFEVDEGPRADTSVEALAKLKPVFHAQGTVTAGNSSQTSDGAARPGDVSERARALGLKPLARFVSFCDGRRAAGNHGHRTGGRHPEGAGAGRTAAGRYRCHRTERSLRRAGAGRHPGAGLDINKVNVNGGAIALGHPLGCTGAKLTATMLHEMRRRNLRYGMVTMCIGGGQGAAGIFQRL